MYKLINGYKSIWNDISFLQDYNNINCLAEALLYIKILLFVNSFILNYVSPVNLLQRRPHNKH